MAMINQTTLFDRSIQKQRQNLTLGTLSGIAVKIIWSVKCSIHQGQKRRQVWFLSELFSYGQC